jgi:Type ISP C-terminal specificity domain
LASRAQIAVVERYLSEVSRLRRSGHAADEVSYYPALNALISGLGATLSPGLTTVPSPAAIGGDFPDIGIFESDSQVLALPVEAKPPERGATSILQSGQAARYARSWGGGDVLVTNLWDFGWGRLDSAGVMQVLGGAKIVGGAAELDRRSPTVDPIAVDDLLGLLASSCALRPSLTEPSRIAGLLAFHARQMVHEIEDAGDPKLLLRFVAESMRDGLGMDLDAEFFAPTVVQTLVYGLFAAWLKATNPQTFESRDAEDLLEVEVIASLFHQLTDSRFVRRCDLRPHLDATSRVLQWIDRPSFESKFDAGAVEYFYEPFLAAFDSTVRDKLGVWYTPHEIAEYQVARVDQHLRDDLGMPDGLADSRVIILDPAVGTGTYLRAALARINDIHRANGEPDALAASRARTAATTRVVGFEVLPAALIVGHINIGRYLAGLGAPLRPSERVRIYLTNSLTGWGGKHVPTIPLPGLEDELRAALHVKHDESVIVVMGNPPYQGYSATENADERSLLGPWIDPLGPVWGLRKHRLGDLYVRFWRIAVRRIAEMTGRGVVSFITNRKWLGGRSFPAMRGDILQKYQRLVVDDLHGDVHDTSRPDDGSVFTTEIAAGIQRGVAIVTAVRVGPPDTGAVATVMARDFDGSGEVKRRELQDLSQSNIDAGLNPIPVSAATRWRLVPDQSADYPQLDEYLHFRISGVQPVRDVVMDEDRDALERRMRAYYGKLGWGRLIERYPDFAVQRERYDPEGVRARLRAESSFKEERIRHFLFKPFDDRYIYWEPDAKLLNEARSQLIPYFELVSDQQVLIVPQTRRRPGAARPLVTRSVPGYHSVDPDARAFPRVDIQLPVLDSGTGDQYGLGAASGPTLVTNVLPEWIAGGRAAGLTGSDLEVGDVVFFSLVAVMHSSIWSESIEREADDFPSVPIPGNGPDLLRAAELGHRIADLLDVRIPVRGVTAGRLASGVGATGVPVDRGDRVVGPGEGAWAADDGGTIPWGPGGGWTGVTRKVADYSLGGFPVVRKWLSYRRGDRLTDADVETVTEIVRRIGAIIALEADCDSVFAAAQKNPLQDAAAP